MGKKKKRRKGRGGGRGNKTKTTKQPKKPPKNPHEQKKRPQSTRNTDNTPKNLIMDIELEEGGVDAFEDALFFSLSTVGGISGPGQKSDSLESLRFPGKTGTNRGGGLAQKKQRTDISITAVMLQGNTDLVVLATRRVCEPTRTERRGRPLAGGLWKKAQKRGDVSPRAFVYQEPERGVDRGVKTCGPTGGVV